MADLTITASAVIAGANAVKEQGIAGEALVAGKAVYKDPATKKWMLADNDSATVAARSGTGVALNGASNGQPVSIHKTGDLTVGAILTPGLAYYVSSTPGGICPAADLGSGDYPVLVGMAKSSSVLNVAFVPAGVALS